MLGDESTQGERRSLELSALPRLIVPTTDNVGSTSPHALSVDFRCHNGESVSPCSEVSPSSRCSLVSLSPSLFPLPPTVPTPATSNYSIKLPDSPPGTSRSQSSITSWFSPPSPPPSTPLPPTPSQKKLASLIASQNGLESLPAPANVMVKSPYAGSRDSDPAAFMDPPMTPPRRTTTHVVDTRGNRESAVDPDAPLSPPPSSLPPPYSPGVCTPERFSHVSVANSRVDSTTPILYYAADHDGGLHSPAGAREGRRKCDDLEAGRVWPWQKTEPKRRRKRKIVTMIAAAAAALLMVVAGVTVGVYLAVSSP
ncbi:hypothetical protein F4820DRAFT_417949 [Hypoxylon rubiginosum]|uniref:Uncharacterized protein n=1 Tax=Hypoxylon rubiginosum TaxID=110542 RepID=A0ACB9Z3Y9_9PEZI|nr:hypothetical protein F4820DRAFT_417949 [Hypoxylon rubiginosum]